ncbi:ATP-grasp domain-containing protein [Xenorhabdus thailandensis]|uniref:ATP-grasp domain-containing protein n=1 Tax=Xenorhabdus thailandensis TaxID=3136255 RepID=UPI0030F38790
MKKPLLLLDRGGIGQYLRKKDSNSTIDRSQFYVVVITNASKISQFYETFYDELHLWDTDNDEIGLIAFAMELHAKTPFHRVIACSERLLLVAAQLREMMDCEGDRYQDIIGVRDKAIMHDIARNSGIKTPQQWLASDYERCASVLSTKDSLILKPRRGMGSRGIYHAKDASAFFLIIDKLKAHSIDLDSYLIETYIEGGVFHIDSVISHGNVIFEIGFEYLSPPMQFTDSKPRAAIMLSAPEVAVAIYQANRQVISAFNIQDGVTHTEFFYTPSGEVVFGEVAKRVGGGVISEAIYQLSGIDLNTFMVQFQLGKIIDFTVIQETQYGGWLKFHPRPLKISSLSDVNEFADEWIKFAVNKKQIGDLLSIPYMTGDSIADFVIAAPNEPLLRARINDVINRFRCE